MLSTHLKCDMWGVRDMTKHLVMQEDPALFMAFDEYTRCVMLDAFFSIDVLDAGGPRPANGLRRLHEVS